MSEDRISQEAEAALWDAMKEEMATWPRGFDPENDKRPETLADWSAFRGDWVAAAALRALRGGTVGGWQPIDTAPKDGTWIIGCDARGHREIMHWWDFNQPGKWHGARQQEDPEPIVWMPLPDGPTKEAKP